MTQAASDAGRRPGTTTTDAERLAGLEREVKELRRANAILRSSCSVRCDEQLKVDITRVHVQNYGV